MKIYEVTYITRPVGALGVGSPTTWRVRAWSEPEAYKAAIDAMHLEAFPEHELTGSPQRSIRLVEMSLSDVERRNITTQVVVNGKLVTWFKQADHPEGRLVCEPLLPAQSYEGVESETVTRLGSVFWDLGKFTPTCET